VGPAGDGRSLRENGWQVRQGWPSKFRNPDHAALPRPEEAAGASILLPSPAGDQPYCGSRLGAEQPSRRELLPRINVSQLLACHGSKSQPGLPSVKDNYLRR